jgi:hypothetical protein
MQPLVIDIYHGDPVQDFAKVESCPQSSTSTPSRWR